MACGRHARPASPGRAISFTSNGRRCADRSAASGRLSLDGVVRAFIREKLSYRFTTQQTPRWPSSSFRPSGLSVALQPGVYVANMCGTRRRARSVVRDLVAGLLRHMEDKHATTVTPSLRPADAEMERRPFCDPENFSFGYIMRSQDILFKQASRAIRSRTSPGRPGPALRLRLPTTCRPFEITCWQTAAAAKRSLMVGVTEGCEVQAGAGEEAFEEPAPAATGSPTSATPGSAGPPPGHWPPPRFNFAAASRTCSPAGPLSPIQPATIGIPHDTGIPQDRPAVTRS